MGVWITSVSLWLYQTYCFECLQAKGLETRESYVFRVRAVNTSGIGMASTPSDPVCIKALPGKPVL